MDHGRTNNSGNQRLYHDDILPGGICDDDCRVTGTNRNYIRGYYLFKTASIQYKDMYSVSLSFHIEGIL